MVRASFLCEESKPIERDEQNEKTKNGSICDPFWSFCSELLNVVCLGWLHRLRVLKIFRIKTPNPKKGFMEQLWLFFVLNPFFRSTAEKVTQLICHIIGRGLLSLFPRLEEWKIVINPSIY